MATHECFSSRSRPLKAVASLVRMRGNKEATHHIFAAIAHLEGPTTERMFQNFRQSDTGARILAEERDLLEPLMDRDHLASLPEGALGRRYLDFVEAEGLSARAFEEEMARSGERFDQAGPERRRFLFRVRHMHDILHVLTGYGRDPLGEFCVLAFTSEAATGEGEVYGSRIRRRGVELIVQGHRRMARQYPDLPVKKCIAEARALGRAADVRTDLLWEELLTMPLRQVQERYGIGQPTLYLRYKDLLTDQDRAWREANTG